MHCTKHIFSQLLAEYTSANKHKEAMESLVLEMREFASLGVSSNPHVVTVSCMRRALVNSKHNTNTWGCFAKSRNV
jgi:hypothetical protein